MRFLDIEIQNFRNLSSVRLELGEGVNYFWGENGAGKTALLEAVCVLARGRSFRSTHAADLVTSGQDAFTVRASFLDEHRGTQSVAVMRSRSGRSRLKLNGESGKRLSDVARILPVQVLLPSLSDLVFGSPVERRRWLDWGLFHVKPDYLRTLREYLQLLKQRNAALKSFARGDLPQSGIDVWTRKLVIIAEQLDKQRRDYMGEAAAESLNVLRLLSPELEIAIKYHRGWSETESLEKVLSDSQARDVKLGATSAGPHRCEIELGAGPAFDSRASAILSRGQGKLLASAMVLGQARLLMRVSNRNSVFLIDDLGAEMDQQHSAALFRILREMSSQILATSTHPIGESRTPTLTPETMFHVEHGKVSVRPREVSTTFPEAT